MSLIVIAADLGIAEASGAEVEVVADEASMSNALNR